jgi:hypothetical protein
MDNVEHAFRQAERIGQAIGTLKGMEICLELSLEFNSNDAERLTLNIQSILNDIKRTLKEIEN